MSDDRSSASGAAAEATRLRGLLRDLATLQRYLEERGRHTYELAQRFLENSRRDAGSRAYDERQATMLEYQHYIWHEIAGRLNQLLLAYGDAYGDTEGVDSGTADAGADAAGTADSQRTGGA